MGTTKSRDRYAAISVGECRFSLGNPAQPVSTRKVSATKAGESKDRIFMNAIVPRSCEMRLTTLLYLSNSSVFTTRLPHKKSSNSPIDADFQVHYLNKYLQIYFA
jgi:hypothetical protein